jgi:hypothetical protein
VDPVHQGVAGRQDQCGQLLGLVVSPPTLAEASAGDAIVVPAGAVFKIDNLGGQRASAWVTTSVGLEAMLADGSSISPPWVR